MTLDEKLSELATRLNARIDIPLVPEVAEQFAFERVAKRIGRVLPEPMVDLALSASDGVTEDEAKGWSGAVRKYLEVKLPAVLLTLPIVPRALDMLEAALVDLLTAEPSGAIDRE